MSEPEARVPVRSQETGEVVTVPASQVKRATSYLGGYTLATPEQIAQQRSEQEPGLLDKGAEALKAFAPVAAGGVARTFAGPAAEQAVIEAGRHYFPKETEAREVGMLSGVSAGLLPAAAGLAVPEYGKHVLRLQQEAPTAFGLGETAGQLGGVIMGGAAAGAKGLGGLARYSPVGLMDAAGAGADSLVAKGLARVAGEGAVSQILRAGAQLGVRGAIDNGLYSATHELSEEMLGDPSISAEKIWAAGKHGAITGALFGGVAGAAGKSIELGVRGLAGHAHRAVENAADDLEKAADEWAAKSVTGGYQKARQAADRVGGLRAVGRTLREEGVIEGDVMEALKSGHPDQLLDKVSAAKSRIGAAIGDIHATSPATMTAGDIAKSFDRAIDQIRPSAVHQHVVANLEASKAAMLEQLGAVGVDPFTGGISQVHLDMHVPIQDVIAQRKFLDKTLKWESSSLDPMGRVDLLRQVRGDLEEKIKASIESAAEKAGDKATGAALRDLSKRYSHLSVAEDGAERMSQAMAANRTVGLTDYLGGGAAAHIGTAIGGFVGGAPGAALGGFGGGIAGAALNRLARIQGPAAASAALGKLAQFAQAQRSIRVSTEEIAKAAKVLAGAGAEPAIVAAPRARPALAAGSSLSERYRKAVDNVSKMQTDPRGLIDRAAASNMTHLPQVSAQMAATTMRAADYLGSKVPKNLDTPTIGLPFRLVQSDPDMAKFLRSYDAVTGGPIHILGQIQKGNVTREHVEALKVVAPGMYHELQVVTLDHIAKRQAIGKPVPFEKRNALGIVLGIPADPSQRPETMKNLQENVADHAYNGQDTPNPGTANTAPRRPVELNTQPSKFDEIEAG